MFFLSHFELVQAVTIRSRSVGPFGYNNTLRSQRLGGIDISSRKARTASLFDMNTGEIGKLSQPGGPLFGIENSNDGLITFPGGIPLKDTHGNVVGAIGVSGSTVENDHAVAAVGAAQLTK